MSLFDEDISIFPHSYDEIIQRIHKINPIKYGSTRNYIDGAVTYLSPYISRGVISTKQVLSAVIARGYDPNDMEKFIQELAWRDYWQQIWIAKGSAINSDLKHQQSPISNTGIANAITDASTGIDAIDQAIQSFYKSGYLHNHIRMYLAALACNMAHSHWKAPAQWMYYYLLDADWASNALSWQWVAGANSNKKYIANQDNINKYCYSDQKNTFLDVSYETLAAMEIPKELAETKPFQLKTHLPKKESIVINEELPTLIYNFYNLDPEWKSDAEVNRVLLLEPSHFKEYPISKHSVDFMLRLSENITNVQVYVGEFSELVQAYELRDIYYKEHPLNLHYKGIEEARDWMFDVKGYYPSFFTFWKKCKKTGFVAYQ